MPARAGRALESPPPPISGGSDSGGTEDGQRAQPRASGIPRKDPHKMWGGPASGRATCERCGERIERGLEFELEFGSAIVFLHEHCFFAWDRERRQGAS